jgi:hypothetical protein
MQNMGQANKDITSRVGLGSQKEHQIDFEFEGKGGTFVFRRPSLKDRMTISTLEANFLGHAPRNSIDLQGQTIARIMATFTVVMHEAPDWFDLNTLDDYEFAEKLYLEYLEVVRPFRGSVSKGNNEASPGAGGA